MQHVMQIVVPLRRVANRPPDLPAQPARLVRVVFEHQMNRPVGDPPPHGLRQFGQDVGVAVVDDRVHRVEPQPVEIVLLEPIERVLDHEVAHRAARDAVVIDRRAPRRAVPLGKEIRAMTCR